MLPCASNTALDAIVPCNYHRLQIGGSLHARRIFRRIAGVRPISLLGEQRRIAQRFQNRLELRMILMDLAALRMIGPGQYKSMGTGGLKNEEVRALHYRLSLEQVPQKFPDSGLYVQATFAQRRRWWRVRITHCLQELLNTSADAQRLLTMLERKVSEVALFPIHALVRRLERCDSC